MRCARLHSIGTDRRMKFLVVVASFCATVHAWRAPVRNQHVRFRTENVRLRNSASEPMMMVPPPEAATMLITAAEAATVLITDAAAPNAIAAAFVAYGHYFAILLSVASLTVERLLVKPTMNMAEEQTLATADAAYGVAGLLLAVTGYLRATSFGKGWEFYSHEPIFWVKLTLLSVAGAASFFPTVKIIQRSVAQRQTPDVPIAPMSEKLAARMTSIINAELLAFASIPLSATLMARGVGYAEWLPWQLGAAPPALALVGLGYKYIKEALDWVEDE